MIETFLANANVISTITAVVTFANAILPVVPEPYKTIIGAVGVLLFTVFHITSHTPASLGAVARKNMGKSL